MLRNLFTHPSRMPLVAASILSADFAHMEAECRSVLEAGADLLHVDVMDGHFVPNLTMGPDMVRCLRRALPKTFMDVHMMVTDPELYIDAFAQAGADHLTFHVEAVAPERIAEVTAKIRGHGLSAGLAINPPTPVEQILPHVEGVDLVLVMSVNPGRSGQAFMGEVLDKTRRVAELLQPVQRLEMDGGLKPANARQVSEAGCDVMVAASAIFGLAAKERPAAIAQLHGRDV